MQKLLFPKELEEVFEAWWQESFGNVTVVCPEEVAQVLGKDRSAIYRAIRRGEIPAKPWGKRGYLILKPHLKSWFFSDGRFLIHGKTKDPA